LLEFNDIWISRLWGNHSDWLQKRNSYHIFRPYSYICFYEVIKVILEFIQLIKEIKKITNSTFMDIVLFPLFQCLKYFWLTIQRFNLLYQYVQCKTNNRAFKLVLSPVCLYVLFMTRNRVCGRGEGERERQLESCRTVFLNKRVADTYFWVPKTWVIALWE